MSRMWQIFLTYHPWHDIQPLTDRLEQALARYLAELPEPWREDAKRRVMRYLEGRGEWSELVGWCCACLRRPQLMRRPSALRSVQELLLGAAIKEVGDA